MEADVSLVTLLTGPASSVVLLGGMALGFARFTTGTLVPAVSRWVDAHLSQVDRLIDEHGKDREAWLKSMRECREQGDRIERKVGGLYGRLDNITTQGK